ncbi:zinc finger CCCH domain-containing protein 8-like [Penaeus chinensis]|uniref:zinc finger CCCH domain-containing protein 8-like n=1 Tax=Penaeus chinensis TaxID=139456 RepID=UPI001FB60C51|nr:zinc finger CCCH domain-containing protein 8-like [Penaeus chinensis]
MAGLSGLVADYGSSSDGEQDDDNLAEELRNRVEEKKSTNFFESPPDETNNAKKSKKKPDLEEAPLAKPEILENPLRGNAIASPFAENTSASVFFNPFHKAQEDKKLVLEKHVKMTDNPKDVMEINGKKICWNYRKGRCKFGHKCKFAHDSDISQPLDPKEAQTSSTNPSSLSQTTPGTQVLVDEPASDDTLSKKKKRPGLSDGLVPGKKVQKLYRSQQAKESPWLLKR